MGYFDSLANLPPGANPYDEAFRIVEKMLKPEPNPWWSDLLIGITFFGFALMLFQALFLVYQRNKINAFVQLSYNKLGLLQIHISDSMGLSYTLYSIASISQLFLVKKPHRTVLDTGPATTLNLCFLYHLGSAFLWACVSYCAVMFWDLSSGKTFSRELLKKVIQWAMCLFFFLTILVPMPIILWAYAMVFLTISKMRSIAYSVLESLQSAALTYVGSGTTNDRLHVQTLLSPIHQLTLQRHDLENYLLIGIKTYTILSYLFIILFFPTTYFCNKYLFKSSVKEVKLECATDPPVPAFRRWKAHNLRRQQAQLYRLTFFAFLCQFIHIPGLMWQLTHSAEGFSHNTTWHRVTEHGLNLPLAIVGNFNLYFLILHSQALMEWFLVKRVEERPSFTKTGDEV
ncbi:hypothetical protein O181_059253 [Austropuccinia psidii MF-1]|uniref:Uncharacterized protein n=1 Tax=Austropuccinia psidii MF-1 TaxID=1389203 RepID=A0A9Q3EIF7_9BASI|nr:hypothetical protein [Austropuccinia psidii MF-1]